MSDLNKLQDAFMKADGLAQQGNAQAAEDAKMFAQEIRRLQSSSSSAQPEEKPQMMSQVNRGIADAAGGLVDFFNPFDQPHALNPFPQGTGSAQTGLTSAMEGIGAEVAQGDPQNAWQAAQRGFGNAAATVVPVAKAGQMVSKAGGMVGQLADDITGSLSSFGGTGSEILAGGIAGGAQQGAKDAGLPDWAQNTAAVMAPLSIPAAARVAQMTPGVQLARQGVRSATAAMAPYTNAGGREVARNRVQSLAGGPDRAGELANRLNGDTEINLTPARQINDQNMIGLEDLAATQDPNLRERLNTREGASRASAQSQVNDMGGDVSAARDFVAQRKRTFEQDLNQKANTAIDRANEQIRAIGPSSTEAQNAQIVTQEIDRSLADALAQEKQLWAAVPKDETVPTGRTLQTAQNLVSQTPRAQRNDIPRVINELLIAEDGFGNVETVSEMHGLYSELRRVARSAMAGNDQNKNMARIANETADAILEDLGAKGGMAVPGVSQPINEARAFSSALHEAFDQGAVGRLRKRTIDGDTAVDPELALQRTIGRGGQTASVANQQINRATQSERSYYAIEDYIKERFSNSVTSPSGEFTPAVARRFMRDNQALLDQYPDLMKEISGAVGKRDGAEAVQKRIADVIKASQNSRQSALSNFLDGPPEKAIDGIFTAKSPIRAARILRNAVGKDASGEALAGLKGAFADRLMARSSRTVDGRSQIDPNKFGAMLEDGQMSKSLAIVFSPAEMSRMRRLAKELNALDAPGANVGTSLSGTNPNKLIEYAVRVFAARQGAELGGGGGGSLQTAQMASARAREILGRLVSDKSSQIIADAIEDPELFRALLTDVGKLEMEEKVFPKFLPYLVGGASVAQAQ